MSQRTALVTHVVTRDPSAVDRDEQYLFCLRFHLRHIGFDLVIDAGPSGVEDADDGAWCRALHRQLEAARAVVIVHPATAAPTAERDPRLGVWRRALAELAQEDANKGRFYVVTWRAGHNALADLTDKPMVRLDRPLGFRRLRHLLGGPVFFDRLPPRRLERLRTALLNDVASAEDGLSFRYHAQAAARLLHQTRPPLVLSIEGEWGSGKSSFMLQLRELLLLRGDAVVSFNPWRLERGESVWASFALEFSRQMAPLDRLSTYQKALRLFLRRLRGDGDGLDALRLLRSVLLFGLVAAVLAAWSRAAAYDRPPAWLVPLAAAGGLYPIVTRTFELAAGVANPLKESIRGELRLDPGAMWKKLREGPDYGSRVGFIDAFHADFRRIVEVYADKKTFVFIDDLDRCEATTAAELLSALNLMIPDEPNLVFVLAVDRPKLAAAIAVRNEKVLPFLAPAADKPGYDLKRAIDYGHTVLEKFVQISIRLPQIHRDALEGWLDTLIRAEAADDAARVRDLALMVAPALEYNPRRMKHFLNRLFLQAQFEQVRGAPRGGPSAQTAAVPLSWEHRAKLLAIAVRWPELLDDLDRAPTLLADLEMVAVDPDADVSGIGVGAVARHWAGYPALLRLLAYGLDSPEAAAQYSFLGVDVTQLRRLLSPRRQPPAPASERSRT